MTTPIDVCARIESQRLVAIIRTDDAGAAEHTVEILAGAGVDVIEFSLAGRSALAALRACRLRFGDELTLGAGTILTLEHVEQALDEGAAFLVSPNVDPTVIDAAARGDVLHIPGAFTPTEMALARRLGARLVKLFPAVRLGPAYVRDLLGPFPDLRIVATGGITAENAADFLDAGCVAVAAGGALTGDHEAARKLRAATAREERRPGP
jgi:2-dehydro-3-deoxyphosphogluconate aldolase / (4S)-4-hydroxy-2-oxoglutarate aldolase